MKGFRLAAKADGNQTKLVAQLRKIGCKVLHIHRLKNCADLVVGYRGKLYFFEIKDGSKPKSQKRLTDGEIKFMEEWKEYPVFVVESIDDCIKIFDKN